MSAFEVNITPSRVKSNKRLEGREPTQVVMAPFSAKAIVTFEDVPVTKTAKRTLRIFNPSQDPIEVTVTKSIRAEHNITTDWTTNVVPAEDEVDMEMVWSPTIEIACKETLQLTDNRNFRKDVMVILKSIGNKPISKNVKRYPTISSNTSHVKTLRLKSPTAPKPNRHRQSPSYKAQKTDRISPVARKHQTTKPKKQISPLLERNVPHIIVSHTTNVPSDTTSYSQMTSHVLKENVSPLSPGNVLDMIDNMQFTPATDTKSKIQVVSEIEYLSSLPTPINRNTANNIIDEAHLIREIRPRRLTVTVESSEDEMSPMNYKLATRTTCTRTVFEFEKSQSEAQPQTINNKTFELKVLDKSDSFTDFQENLENACNKIILNKTTTLTPAISRPLAMIEEEEPHSSQNILQKTYEIAKVDEQLKRDIKLIGTPLRKYSESMKDLSLKSPSFKIPIQGSMPNLNEMESIRSIEQNRYYHTAKITSTVERKTFLRPKTILLDDSDGSNSSATSSTSQVDLLFNQHEILAQSSRFNLNEIGKKPLKKSPITPSPPQYLRRKPLASPAKATGNKRYRDVSIDSPLSDASTYSFPRANTTNVSPPKRAKLESELFPRFSNGVSSGKWSHVQPKKPKLARTLSLIKKPVTPRKIKDEPIVKLYDSEMYMQSFINPDPFAATTTIDPFLASTMYLDEQAVEKHQIAFKKWLNALVSIPAELDPDCNEKIDVGRLFNEARNKELILAPTKEEQSMNYLTKFRLESLRQEAVRFYMSEEMQAPCSKVAVYVFKNVVRIRKDRDLHLDVVMQRNILELLLCFNPLWLRLGLEVVFAEKIHLHSCSDVVGLSTFIVNRLFKDKYIEQKYSRAYALSDEYAEYIKKYTLQRVLLLLLFLDKAKTKRIIKHNPCLFVKKSPYKEVREILLRFSSELLGNVGDITRDLRRIGYVLTHKQNFLDEFNYAFKNLAVDLRDGIRLARVMEIILLRDDLSRKLRVPAISRLQRIYNVNLSLRALAEADFQLKGDIVSADIVDGHREKTLSLLWQIIYKFRSPKFHAAATVIQRWWRNRWLSVCIRRRIRAKIKKRRNDAATVIQSAFRGYMSRKFVKVYHWERTIAVTCLQKYVRRYLAQKHFIRTVRCVVHIQRWYRAVKYGKEIRQSFLEFRNRVVFIQRWVRRVKFTRTLKQAAEVIRAIRVEAELRHRKAIVIQRYFKSIMLRRKLQRVVYDVISTINASKVEYKSAAKIQSFCKMLKVRKEFKKKREAVCTIQRVWRSYAVMKEVRAHYLLQRASAVQIQRQYRGLVLMRQERAEYQKSRSLIVKLQNRFRANKLCAIQRTEYLQLRKCTIAIQQRFRATRLMKIVRADYLRQRSAVIKYQQRFRALLCMRKQRAEYKQLRSSAICLQRRFRAHLQMKSDRAEYLKTRSAIVKIQRKLRATLLSRKLSAEYVKLTYYTTIIQQHYRAIRQRRIDRAEFLAKRRCVIQLQRRFRALQQMRVERKRYLQLRNSALVIQRRFRAHRAMRFYRAKFRGQKLAAMYIQQRFREYKLTKQMRNEFLVQRKAAIVIQRKFRARQTMKETKLRYERTRKNIINIQRRWRANQAMKIAKMNYERSRKLIIAIQHRFRAKLLGRQIRADYEKQKAAAIVIQRRFRATRVMTHIRESYIARRELIIRIQRRIRSYILMKKQRKLFCKQRSSIVRIQTWFRSILVMRRERAAYIRTRQCIILIQQRWRATLSARKQRAEYSILKKSVTIIQIRWRAILDMRHQRAVYLQQRKSILVLQRHYRARLQMLKMRSQYLLIRSLVVYIQRKFRADKAMRIERERFLKLKATVIFIQQKFRGRIETVVEREKFNLIRRTTVGLQAAARGFLARKRYQELMTPEMKQLIAEKKAARVIQRFWRGYRVRKRWQNIRIRTIRDNIKLLKRTTNSLNTIRWKVQDSVRILRGRFNASEALSVLSRLERMSRTVPHLLMDHSDFISTFCYGIMAQAIRSEVDKQLIELCSRIILNLARYNSTTANTFQEGGLVTIAQMLLRWCDKDCEIFNTLCTLIWVFAHCPLKRRKIREFMTTPEAIYVVRETKKLVARKEKMRKNIRKPAITSFPSRCQQQQGVVFSNKALPNLEPDYGVIRNKPYTFVSSVYAFDTILSKLNIDIHSF